MDIGARAEETARTVSDTVAGQMPSSGGGQYFHLGCHRFQIEMETASRVQICSAFNSFLVPFFQMQHSNDVPRFNIFQTPEGFRTGTLESKSWRCVPNKGSIFGLLALPGTCFDGFHVEVSGLFSPRQLKIWKTSRVLV